MSYTFFMDPILYAVHAVAMFTKTAQVRNTAHFRHQWSMVKLWEEANSNMHSSDRRFYCNSFTKVWF